jgi:hypothetical protein
MVSIYNDLIPIKVKEVFQTIPKEVFYRKYGICEYKHELLENCDTKRHIYCGKYIGILENSTMPYRQELLDIFNIAYSYLEKAGYYNYDKKYGKIEFWKYECDNVNNRNESPLTEHKDDDQDLGYRMYAVIFYISNTFDSGGSLFIHEKDEKIKICTKDEKVVVMKGDVLHSIEEMVGKGKRECIVIQVKRFD